MDEQAQPAAQQDRPTIDRKALREKYRQERDKRLRADGNAQYIELKDQLAHYLEDPYIEVQPREPVTDHVTVAIIGGGFGGLATGARLVERGITDVRVLDKAGDFGGTWYWNRYPGAQCDTASFVYMPLLEETGHMPSEKYAHAPEILEHSRRIGRHFGLYDKALFHTAVTALQWDDAAGHWIVFTNRGDEFTAQYITMGNGGLHVPKLPGVDGIAAFEGHSFHTSRWDYDYTGGDEAGAPVDKLADKRVALIGTGATSVQVVPRLAGRCKQLYVFQRTPSTVAVRNNVPTDPEWFETIATPGWQQRWLENFTANQTGSPAAEDLVKDGWTDGARRFRERLRALPADQRNARGFARAMEDADNERMEEIRARIDSEVDDPETAQKLKAWYRGFCKRPCFHDEYLQAYNDPSTTVIDTDGKGVERIDANAVYVDGQRYEVDCIIYASGFLVSAPFEKKMGFDLTGKDGVKLSEYWADGMRSKHGIHVHGFPNAFMIQPTQGANLLSNVPHNLVEAGKTIAMVIEHAQRTGKGRIEVTAEAEQAWFDLIVNSGRRGMAGMGGGISECTPGYYNNEGQPGGPAARTYAGYPMGASAYFKYLDDWRTDGKFDGLAFS